jgi:hypothetical protein
VLKGDLIFADEEGGASGASPSFDACTWIFLGVTWASPTLSFCPFFISSHHSPIPTLKNFPKSSMIKKTQKESDKAANTNIGRNLSK